ncbi:MAG: PGPGW domain-containing protein [Bryobacteraceae bacterium]
MKKILRLLTGIGLLLIGLAGLLLPILPGWLFIIPGLIILADYFPPVRRLVDWAKKKMEGLK